MIRLKGVAGSCFESGLFHIPSKLGIYGVKFQFLQSLNVKPQHFIALVYSWFERFPSEDISKGGGDVWILIVFGEG